MFEGTGCQLANVLNLALHSVMGSELLRGRLCDAVKTVNAFKETLHHL